MSDEIEKTKNELKLCKNEINNLEKEIKEKKNDALFSLCVMKLCENKIMNIALNTESIESLETFIQGIKDKFKFDGQKKIIDELKQEIESLSDEDIYLKYKDKIDNFLFLNIINLNIQKPIFPLHSHFIVFKE